MNWNLYKKCLRVILFLDNPKEIGKSIQEHQIRTDENIVDSTVIHVEEDIPNFLKNVKEQVNVPASRSIQQPSNDFVLESLTDISDSNNSVCEDIRTRITPSPTKPHTEIAQESLLNNKPLVQMFEECGLILKELERIKPGFQSEDSLDLMEIVKERIMQAMYLSGGKPIDNETEFDILRHSCKEKVDVNNGDKIAEFIEPGISLEDRIIVKAQVKIKK